MAKGVGTPSILLGLSLLTFLAGFYIYDAIGGLGVKESL